MYTYKKYENTTILVAIIAALSTIFEFVSHLTVAGRCSVVTRIVSQNFND